MRHTGRPPRPLQRAPATAIDGSDAGYAVAPVHCSQFAGPGFTGAGAGAWISVDRSGAVIARGSSRAGFSVDRSGADFAVSGPRTGIAIDRSGALFARIGSRARIAGRSSGPGFAFSRAGAGIALYSASTLHGNRAGSGGALNRPGPHFSRRGSGALRFFHWRIFDASGAAAGEIARRAGGRRRLAGFLLPHRLHHALEHAFH